MSDVPLKETPPINLAVWRDAAVCEFPKRVPVKPISPTTSNEFVGVIVFIPTLPVV